MGCIYVNSMYNKATEELGLYTGSSTAKDWFAERLVRYAVRLGTRSGRSMRLLCGMLNVNQLSMYLLPT